MTDWKELPGDSREKYNLYLCSREWGQRRAAVHERAGGRCERCRRNPMDSCHHLTYARKYQEKLEDLQAICKPCHEFTHGRSSFDPLADATEPAERIERQLLSVCAEEGLLLCPQCGYESLNLGSIEIHQGNLVTFVGFEDCRCVGVPIDGDRRGTKLVATFVGECGHVSRVSFEFHKGRTFAGVVDSGENSITDRIVTLWRD